MPGECEHRKHQRLRASVTGQYGPADLRSGRRDPGPHPPAAHGECGRRGEHTECEQPELPAHRGAARQRGKQPGLAEQHDAAEAQQHDLAGDPLIRDGPHATGHVPCGPPMANAAVDVAEQARGKHGVEQQRPVVLGDRTGQAQRKPDPAGDQAPPQRAEHRGQPADAEGEQHRPRPDDPHTVDEGVRTELGDQRDENARAEQQPQPWPRPPHHCEPPGSASRSTCCTTTRSVPASTASTRRCRYSSSSSPGRPSD